MQDIFDASGLSAGAVYRYFPSKDSLIKAIAQNALNEVMIPAIDAVAGQRLDPADALASLTALFEPGGLRTRSLPVTVQVWAEAFRDPQMAGLARDAANHISARLAQVLPAGTPPEAARLIMAALQGFVIQSGSLADVTPELVAAASRAFARGISPLPGENGRAIAKTTTRMTARAVSHLPGPATRQARRQTPQDLPGILDGPVYRHLVTRLPGGQDAAGSAPASPGPEGRFRPRRSGSAQRGCSPCSGRQRAPGD
jgi:TetR/AcrR family transcriptional regulator, transcriptional repressor of aconitase